MEPGPIIRPEPEDLEDPQECHRLREIPDSGKDQGGVKKHLHEHHKEKGQEAVSEPPALHPAGNILFPGKTEASAQEAQKLPSAAVPVTAALGAGDHGNAQRDKEAEQSQPGGHDIEKAQGQICQGQDPEIVVPFFLHVHRAAVSYTHLCRYRFVQQRFPLPWNRIRPPLWPGICGRSSRFPVIFLQPS